MSEYGKLTKEDVKDWKGIGKEIQRTGGLIKKTICIIGTTSYRKKIEEHAATLRQHGHTVLIPAFDDHADLDDLGVCEHNRSKIEAADVVHMIWDQRSTGTIFDFGMCFALRKPVRIIYMEKKTFRGVMEKYAKATGETDE